MPWYVYILRCGDGTLYTGITDDVERRLAVHRTGKGAKYTRGRGPLELAYTEQVPDRSAALRRELEVKALSREEILDMVWGRDYFGELKIVDVNIRRLRLKIEDNAQNPTYINTVWGYGYKWGF